MDFNLGLKPQRFVFRGASWGAAAEPAQGGGGGNVAPQPVLSQAALPPPAQAGPQNLWARLEGFGPFEYARNSEKEPRPPG